ncbi:DUF2087 domain-containing protein [Bacillus sp. JCM 19041]|uniref:DUF2087 domain-containing protein n=1 Tax=Bacillus sp. JCM 19041 TaxID=1460637 RepID=UPI0006CFDFE0
MSDQSFWDASIDDLKKGFVMNEERDAYVCLLCGKEYPQGIIYPINNTLFEAKKAIAFHIRDTHSSTFDYLIEMDKKYTGLSEHQSDILTYFKQGLSDKEIVEIVGGSASTIRNHRFKLKEKEKQAKIFLTLMSLAKETETKKEESFIDFHKGARMMDERYAITEKEREKVMITYFTEGKLKSFPSKEKRKLVVLRHIITLFEAGENYSEKEVNELLKTVFSDFATLRRYLIEYGFMVRDKEGKAYRKNS